MGLGLRAESLGLGSRGLSDLVSALTVLTILTTPLIPTIHLQLRPLTLQVEAPEIRE